MVRPDYSQRKENREDLDGKDFTDKGHAGDEGDVTMSFEFYLLSAGPGLWLIRLLRIVQLILVRNHLEKFSS